MNRLLILIAATATASLAISSACLAAVTPGLLGSRPAVRFLVAGDSAPLAVAQLIDSSVVMLAGAMP